MPAFVCDDDCHCKRGCCLIASAFAPCVISVLACEVRCRMGRKPFGVICCLCSQLSAQSPAEQDCMQRARQSHCEQRHFLSMLGDRWREEGSGPSTIVRTPLGSRVLPGRFGWQETVRRAHRCTKSVIRALFLALYFYTASSKHFAESEAEELPSRAALPLAKKRSPPIPCPPVHVSSSPNPMHQLDLLARLHQRLHLRGGGISLSCVLRSVSKGLLYSRSAWQGGGDAG